MPVPGPAAQDANLCLAPLAIHFAQHGPDALAEAPCLGKLFTSFQVACADSMLSLLPIRPAMSCVELCLPCRPTSPMPTCQGSSSSAWLPRTM